MKINRMTNNMIKEKIEKLNAGQTHVYQTLGNQKVSKIGSSHKNSKYYIHLVEELNRRNK